MNPRDLQELLQRLYIGLPLLFVGVALTVNPADLVQGFHVGILRASEELNLTWRRGLRAPRLRPIARPRPVPAREIRWLRAGGAAIAAFALFAIVR